MEQLTRTELRKKIMTILYQINVYQKNHVAYQVENMIKEVCEIENEFVKDMVYGVITYQNEIDEIANKYLKKWTIDRLGNTDQAILRMGIYELKYTDTPPVVICDSLYTVCCLLPIISINRWNLANCISSHNFFPTLAP